MNTLIERLYKLASIDVVTASELCEEFDANTSDISAIRDAVINIAKAINEEYISRPRYTDGSVVNIGDEIIFEGRPRKVSHVYLRDDGAFGLAIDDGKTTGWYGRGTRANRPEPDSREKVLRDARKLIGEYWGCETCGKCPALVNGKRPYERYHVGDCNEAMRLDLLARLDRLHEKEHLNKEGGRS